MHCFRSTRILALFDSYPSLLISTAVVRLTVDQLLVSARVRSGIASFKVVRYRANTLANDIASTFISYGIPARVTRLDITEDLVANSAWIRRSKVSL